MNYIQTNYEKYPKKQKKKNIRKQNHDQLSETIREK